MTRLPVRKRVTRSRPKPVPQTGMALHTADGARKYLTTSEHRRPDVVKALCGGFPVEAEATLFDQSRLHRGAVEDLQNIGHELAALEDPGRAVLSLAPDRVVVLFRRRRGLHLPHNLGLSLWAKRVSSPQHVIYQCVHDNA